MKIKVTKSKLNGEIQIPGSKSHTIRGIIAALMAKGESTIKNPLVSDDTESCLYAARKLGAEFVDSYENDMLIWKITGTGGNLTNCGDAIIDLGNSGTTLRLMTGVAATSSLKICFDGDSSLRGRPMGTLVSALQKLGAKITAAEGGKCPISIKGPILGGETIVEGKSSQFVSALLYGAPLAKSDTKIYVINLNEKPYLDVTLDWLKFLGIEYDNDPDYSTFTVKGGQKYRAFNKVIPADFSSAAFPLVAAAVTDSNIKIKNLDFTDKQGDKKVFSYMEKMGMKITKSRSVVNVYKKYGLLGDIDLDMNSIPDALPIMSVAGCFARGKTILSNAPHARIKETDRIAAMAQELKKMGGNIEELEDGLLIRKSNLHAAKVNGHGDHRIIMALAVAGMALEGETIIENAKEISVTYPNFIRDFQNLGANIERV
ncbi:MAG TPA: 3-phosphoshikimate 1-carboxyvinyltransferase [Victivallales bacterium]|nr:3-phosphoshikimate 1-carboxyvinyltransferase [Victivallales bacterium]